MGRVYDLYQPRAVHIGLVSTLMLIINCNYIATDQPDAACAILPLVFQCLGALLLLFGRRVSGALVQACRILIGVGAATSTVLSVVYIHHMLQATVAILNAYALATMGIELGAVRNEEES